MDNLYWNDFKEAHLLNLTAEHVPFPCSLRELVLDRFVEPPGAGGNAHPLQVDELTNYLKEIDDFSMPPWVAVMDKIEAIGDPATPSREHTAILRWLGKALEIWEKEFPLEGRLAIQIRRLKPLAAALAVADPLFLQPGAHPLHQLLDTIQERAIGWQSRLDRVGAALEKQVTGTVDESRKWFENHDTDLQAVRSEFASAAERDYSRAQRMVQRVVDTEAGKVRTAAAKQEASRMINAALEEYPVPLEIGEFIKGPWYTSAQLLLLKHGLDSEHWQRMTATTKTLLDSLQSLEDANEERRQRIFEVVTQLPKEMRLWLLSLHHDTEAVNEAMGLVEFTHLRILRQQPVDLQSIDPIVVDDHHATSGEAQHSNALKKWSEGQWFSVTQDDSPIRMQLVLKVEQSQQLLFTNMAGIKILQLSFAGFSQLVNERKAVPLRSGASFSLSLARAAGVDSAEILEALASAMAGAEPPSAASTAPSSKPEPEPIVEPEPELEPVAEPESAPTEPDSELTAELLPIEEAEPFLPTGDPAGEDLQPPDLGEIDFTPPVETPSEGTVADEASLSDFDKETRRFLAEKETQAQASQAETVADEVETEERRIDLPVGVWIGFHDGETPMMARLAVHDPMEDYFIFVNRKGVKIRQIGREEFLDLIDNDLVEILETSSNFRDKVTAVRKNPDK